MSRNSYHFYSNIGCSSDSSADTVVKSSASSFASNPADDLNPFVTHQPIDQDLKEAALKGNTDEIFNLLTEEVDATGTDEDGNTVLHLLAKSAGKMALSDALDNYQNNHQKVVPVSHKYNNMYKIVRLLCEEMSDYWTTLTNNDGKTSLNIASINENDIICAALYGTPPELLEMRPFKYSSDINSYYPLLGSSKACIENDNAGA